MGGNETWRHLVGWGWDGEARQLVVVNFGDGRRGPRLAPWDDLRRRPWRLDDLATGESYQRDGDALHDGLYVALGAWGWHLFN